MTRPTIREMLEQLRNELAQFEPASEQQQITLDGINSQVQEWLADPDDSQEPDLQDRLEEALLLFEADHPRLTEVLNQAITTLTVAGV